MARTVPQSEEERRLRVVAREAAHEAVNEVLVALGIDVTRPLCVQRDMATLREMSSMLHDPDFRQDLTQLRQWRESMAALQKRGLLVVVGTVVAGGLALLWIGLTAWMRGA